jgi:hypothetical protein
VGQVERASATTSRLDIQWPSFLVNIQSNQLDDLFNYHLWMQLSPKMEYGKHLNNLNIKLS